MPRHVAVSARTTARRRAHRAARPGPHLLRRTPRRRRRGSARRPSRATAAACSSSVDLPMPGSPPSSVTEPGDQPAAEHPIELADPRRPRLPLPRVDLGDRQAAERRPQAAPSGVPPRVPRPSVFHASAPRAAPGPLERGRAAVGARVEGTLTGHAPTVRGGCDIPGDPCRAAGFSRSGAPRAGSAKAGRGRACGTARSRARRRRAAARGCRAARSGRRRAPGSRRRS